MPNSSGPNRLFKPLAAVGLVSLGVFGGIGSCAASQYADLPGYDTDSQSGRTINGLNTLIGGIVASELHANSEIDLTAEKFFFPDAHITGQTSPDSIDVETDLTFTSSHFVSEKDQASGQFSGEVKKSEFNWEVRQTSEDTWEVGRLGLKLDTTLKLRVQDGVISGNYERPLSFDWGISGTYDPAGNVKVHLDIPMALDVNLVGKITPSQ